MDRKANLFIVGAMKAGTTTFSNMLKEHPNVYFSPVKEPNFFVNELPTALYEPSRFFNIDRYLKDDFPKDLHIARISTLNQYRKLFSLSEKEKYLAEASTVYFHTEESAKMIYDYNPESKIIILLRDPIKRAISHYKMNLGKGREIRSFEKAIKTDLNLYYKKKLPWYSYLGMSLYDKNVDKYRSLFENVLIINIDDIETKKEKVIKSLFEFLDIEPMDSYLLSHKNKSRNLRYQKVFYFLKKMGLKDYFSKYFKTSFRQRLFKMLSTNNKKELVLSNDLLGELNIIFKAESNSSCC
jgi:hypothetical protein